METSYITHSLLVCATLSGCSSQLNERGAKVTETPATAAQLPATGSTNVSASDPTQNSSKPTDTTGQGSPSQPNTQGATVPAPKPALPDVSISSEAAYTPLPSLASSGTDEIGLYYNYATSDPSLSSTAQLVCVYYSSASSSICSYRNDSGESVSVSTSDFKWTFTVTNCPEIRLSGTVTAAPSTMDSRTTTTPATVIIFPDLAKMNRCLTDNSKLIFELKSKQSDQSSITQILDLQFIISGP